MSRMHCRIPNELATLPDWIASELSVRFVFDEDLIVISLTPT